MVKNSKTNRLNSVAGGTGGLPNIHDVATKKLETKVPPSTTPPPEPAKEALGFAKASPTFKPLDSKVKASKEEEAKAVEENTVSSKEDEVDDNTKSA